MFFQHFFNALTLGSLYGLIAIRCDGVRILRLISFARRHFMLGPISSLRHRHSSCPGGWPVVVAILASWHKSASGGPHRLPACATPRAFRRSSVPSPCPSIRKPLRGGNCFPAFAPRVPAGMAHDAHQFQAVRLPSHAGRAVSSFVLVLGLLWIIHRTKPGLAMAISGHRDHAPARGAGRPHHRAGLLWLRLRAGGGLPGIMWALRCPQINPYMGIFPASRPSSRRCSAASAPSRAP